MLVSVSFGMVMHESSLMEVYFFDGGCLWRVTGPRKKVVVEMVIGMLQREVLSNLGVMMEMVIFVQLMVKGWTCGMVVGVTEGVL